MQSISSLILLVSLALCFGRIEALSVQDPSTTIPQQKITIRLCEGSSCQSKCRGGFSPKKYFEAQIQSTSLPNSSSIKSASDIIRIEEVFCMNQCKRGPNCRIIQNDQVMTYPNDGIMNEMELKRKSFQMVSNDGRAHMIWDVVQRMIVDSEEEEDGWIVKSGDVMKLSDLTPGS
jgi:hypothetical protein